jgi:hypothetical protein
MCRCRYDKIAALAVFLKNISRASPAAIGKRKEENFSRLRSTVAFILRKGELVSV